MPNSTWPGCPLAFLHDVARCLALVRQGQLRLNSRHRLQIGSVAHLAHQMTLKPTHPHPRSEAQAPELSFLVGLLGHAGLVGDVGGTLRLSATAYEWLDQPAEGQLDILRQTWFLSPDLGWRWLPPDRRQHPLDPYWKYVVLEAARLMAELPATAWTPMSETIATLKARGILTRHEAAHNLPRVRRATEERTQRVLYFLLQVILPHLGLVETDGQREELLLRPTSEGATWLRTALSQHHLLIPLAGETAVELTVPVHELVFPPSEDPPLIVDDDLRLAVHLVAPAVLTFEVAHLARLLSPGPPAQYQVTLPTLRQAVSWGYPVADVILMLTRFSRGPLPPAAAAQLDEWRQEMTLVACEPGYRLHAAAPAVLTTLRQREPFRRRTRPFASSQEAWVNRAEAGGLFRYLRRLGYTLSLKQEFDNDSLPVEPSHRRVLPLSQLLVVLRTYQLLRHCLPGLASLDFETLEQDIAAALSPDDLAGVQRLVELHEVLLSALELPQEQDTGWTSERGGGETEKLRDRLQAAIEAGTTLHLTYTDAQACVTHRRVRPLHLERRWGGQYLVAYCELRQDERHFRLDRIIDVEEQANKETGE